MPSTVLEPLHRFHPYCARFPSEFVEAALARHSRPGDSLFDPACLHAPPVIGRLLPPSLLGHAGLVRRLCAFFADLVGLRKPPLSTSGIGGTDMPPRFETSQLLELHRQLCNGDRTASETLAELILEPLVEALSRRFPRTDEQIIWDGVVEAVLDYCARPHQFDAERGVPLKHFLLMASTRNLQNLLRGETRRRARQEKVGALHRSSAVELDPVVGNLLQREESGQLQQWEEDMMRLLQDPTDRQILALRLRGERRTKAFAEILGISHLPTEMQRRQVKRAKDRIDKIIHRQRGHP